MNASRILTREEIASVLAYLKPRAQHSANKFRCLIIFRLSCCCGLRVKEICGLNLGDITTVGSRPAIRIRKAITKGQDEKRRARLVPLWWDSGTLEDLRSWVAYRRDLGAGPLDPFICCTDAGKVGQRRTARGTAKQWRSAIKVLGPERVRQLSIHTGRHTFISQALHMGRKLPEVRDAAGHRSVGTTSGYLHMIESTDVPDLFGSSPAPNSVSCPVCGFTFTRSSP
jgi:integrase